MYFKKNEGIALIQVLLISTILTLLALQFSYTARQQVKTAQSLIEREEARLLAYSLKNKAIFTLLAFELRGINGLPDDLMQLQNLRIGGEKVRYSQVAQIKLEDLSGRLSIYHPTHPAWERFLTELGYTREQVKNNYIQNERMKFEFKNVGLQENKINVLSPKHPQYKNDW